MKTWIDQRNQTRPTHYLLFSPSNDLTSNNDLEEKQVKLLFETKAAPLDKVALSFSVGLQQPLHWSNQPLSILLLHYISYEINYYNNIYIFIYIPSYPFYKVPHPLPKNGCPTRKVHSSFPTIPATDTKKKSASSELWQFCSFTWIFQDTKGLPAFF